TMQFVQRRNFHPGRAMIEPEQLPTTVPVSDDELPILVAPDPRDARYGYTLPGRRLAQVTVTSIVILFFGLIALFFPQAQKGVVPLCLSMVPLFAVALAAAVPLAAAGEEDAPAAPLLAGWAVILGGGACVIS